MSKKVVIGILNAGLVLGMASVALAADGSAQAAGLWSFFGIAIACGFGIGVSNREYIRAYPDVYTHWMPLPLKPGELNG